MAWTKAQRAWGRDFDAPWSPFVTGVRTIADKLPTLAEGVALDVTAAALVGLLVLLLLRGARAGRWPLEPALLTAALWGAPLFSRLVSSQARFALACWPVLLIPSGLRSRPVRLGLGALGGLLSLVLLRRLALGVFSD